MPKNLISRKYTLCFLSHPFKLQKGTRQGCPLSLLLFDLAIEPLFRYLAASPAIQGILVGSVELKLALFADDVIFFPEHPLRDVPINLEKLVVAEALK